MFRELLHKLNLKGKEVTEEKEEYSNRFVKFYRLNKKRLMQERRSLYHEKKKAGICVRCNRPALERIIFCEFHQQKQAGYNKKARSK